MEVDEYQRHEAAERDKSWSAQGIDIDSLIEKVCTYDCHVGASLRLIRALGLRRKESVMLRPNAYIVSFEATGLRTWAIRSTTSSTTSTDLDTCWASSALRVARSA